MPKYLAVFCGSQMGNDPVYREAAHELGSAISQHGWGLVYGGGKVGLMGVVAQQVLAGNGPVIGVIPHPLNTKEVAFEEVTELLYVNTMHERKAIMADRADAFVALPGGYGTMDELFEILTWAQLGIHSKPVALLNVNGFFDPLISFLDRMMDSGLLKPKYRELLLVATTCNELFELIQHWQPSPLNVKWLKQENR
jgi:uncharacterized protein (TIGR00730 family)